MLLRITLGGALLGLLAPLGGCAPDDGVLRSAFGLGPSTSIKLPSADDLGVELTAIDMATAEGRCDADVAAGGLLCEISSLPVVSTSLASPYYRIVLHFTDDPVPPMGSVSDLALDLATSEEDLGRIAPTPLGDVKLTLIDSNLPLERMIGGTVDIVVPPTDPEGDATTYRVLEGVVGNIEDTGGDEPPPIGGGGHHH